MLSRKQVNKRAASLLKAIGDPIPIQVWASDGRNGGALDQLHA